MYRNMLRHWDKALFTLSIGLLIFGYGMAAGRYNLFPANIVNTAVDTLREWRKYWRHYLRIRPEQYIVTAQYPGEGVTVYDRESTAEGVNFLASLWDETLGFRLLAMDGTELHRWDVSLNEIFPDQSHLEQWRHDMDTVIHGMHLFPNGDVVFNFERIGLVRIDYCGEVVWALPNYAHHSVFVDDAGDIWVSGDVAAGHLRSGLLAIETPVIDELIIKLSPDGEELRRISILDAIYASGYEGLLLSKGIDGIRHAERDGPDILHLNDVETLGRSMAAAFPMFNAGDIMISLRNISAVLVLDGDSAAVKWAMVGPFLAQHDPDFRPDGTISIFDNRRFDTDMGGRPQQSRIVVVDPATSAASVAYGDDPSQAFYSGKAGKHQTLANGNILITETLSGRAFEVTANGTVVWEFIHRWDEDEAVNISEAQRYPSDYLAPDRPACDRAGSHGADPARS